MMQRNNVNEALTSALAHHQAGDLEKAECIYREILQVQPNSAPIHNNLGLIFQDRGLLNESVSCFEKALEISPDYAIAHNNLGNVFKEMGEPDKAIKCYQQALLFDPEHADAFYNLGNIFKEREELDKAVMYYTKALQLAPDHADAHNNLAVTFKSKGLISDALRHFEKAVELVPDLADAHWNMGLTLLLSGNFKKGWEKYEWRFKTSAVYRHDFSKPMWDGTCISGQTILLYADQGYGDTIQSIRYAPLVAGQGAKVIVECQRELKTLVQDINGVNAVVVRGEQLPEFDTYCPLFSLPLIFNTTIETIPLQIPYIKPSTVLVEKWRDKIRPDRSRLKAGIVWAGGPTYKNDHTRSCQFDLLLPLLELKNIDFYSLQKGEAAKQADGIKQLIDYTGEISDFSDTAALMENLDLVISVDTAAVHLAGAMGKTAWVLLPFDPDWRWLLDRRDSPWYPAIRLFRQPSPGDWQSVISSVKEDLTALAALVNRL